MGLKKYHLEYFFEMFEMGGHTKFDGLLMCELGNQTIHTGVTNYLESKGVPPCTTGKELFTSIGFKHTSIDLNGRDGALPIDLTTPIVDRDLLLNFDVVTNSGTTEHVSNQFECFKNIHSLCREGGLFIHMVPGVKYRNKILFTDIQVPHGFYNYGFDFFRALASKSEYKLLDERMIRGLVCVTLQKTRNNQFMSKPHFDELHLHIIDEL